MPAGFFDPAGALFGAPDLLQQPQLALAAAGDSDPGGTAQVLAQTSQMVATSRALQEHASEHGDGFVHELFGGIGHSIHSVLHVAGEGLHQLGRPLRDVQHDYRYIRDVYQHHGFFAGAAETLGIVAAGTVGGLLGGSLGAVAAADAVASAEQRLFFADSRERTRDSSAEGYQYGVSPGRDLSRLLGRIPGLGTLENTDKGWGKVVSGTGDLAFDFTADPVIVGFKAESLRRSPEGFTALRRYIAAQQAGRTTALTSFVDRYAPGTRIELGSVDRVDAARRTYSGYRRALDDLAGLDAGGVISKYGDSMSGLAPELGAAKTVDEVHNVFRQAAFDTNFNARLSGSALPTRGLLRTPFSAANEALKNVHSDLAPAEQKGIIRAVGTSVVKPWQAKQQISGAVERKVRTFSGYMPYEVDRATQELSRSTFNAEDTTGLQGIYRVMRYSMGEQAARRWTTNFAMTPGLSERKAIYTEAITDMYKAAGLADDHALVMQVHDLVGGRVAGNATNELYGYGRTMKAAVSEVTHGGGTDQLALWGHQASKQFSFPDFFQLKNAVRDLNYFSRQYGKVDDFVAHYYTNGFFKPLALVTMGFGLRVAASELIPGVMRYGAASMLANRIAASAAKSNYKLAEGEDGHVLAASAKLVGGIDKLVVNEADHDLATRMTLMTQGHIVRGVASTGENSLAMPAEATERAKATQWYLKQRRARVPMQADTSSWQALTRDADQYQDYWMSGLQKASQNKAAQNVAKDLLEAKRMGMPEQDRLAYATRRESDRIRIMEHGDADPYATERDTLARYTVQDPDEFAAARVDDIANQLTGDNGEFHDHLAQMLINGQKPLRKHLDAINVEARPGAVMGHEMVPYVGGNLLSRGVNEGFKRLVDPIINYISREPIFFAAVKENYKALSKAVEKGMLTEDEALTRAMYRGSLDMLPQIHNTALRSQFSQLLRNYLPFYFAQEQALKRAGTLVAKHPAALEQYQLVHHGLTDPNFVHVDDQGGRHLMIPLASGIGGHFLNGAAAMGLPLVGGLPLSVSGDMASLKTVMPEIQQPGVTPIAGLALNKIAQFFPEYSPEVKMLVGDRGFGRTWQDQMIPNAPLRNIIRGLNADESDRSFGSAFATALAAASFHGQTPPADASPAEQQAFIDRVKNNTRSLYFIKAILSAFSPLSPQVTQEDAGLLDEFHSLTAKYGYGPGVQEFLKKHGDKAVSYTVAKSESTNGADIPYTSAAINYVTRHEHLLTDGDTQLAAAALVPQEAGEGDIQVIHDEMLRMHLRASRTPEKFRNAIYVQQGNRQFFADYALHKAAVQQLGDNDVAVTAENARWKDYEAGLKLANPIWAAEFYAPDKTQRAQATLAQLSVMLDKPGAAPAGEQTDLVRGLYEDYRQHQLALASLGTDRSMAHQRAVERDAWDSYLDKRAAEEPRLQSIISSVFKQIGRNT